MPDLVFSVSEVGRYMQRTLQLDAMLSRIRVRGEVSNCKTYPSGHTYFTLKDESSSLKCVWFKQQKSAGFLRLEDGLRIVVSGSITYYSRDGIVQLVVVSATMDGIGAWYEYYKQLEAKFEREGLFEISRKKTIPAARRIGVVTSSAGAVFHDICQVASRRDPRIEITLYPVQVQGEGAAVSIVKGLQWFNSHPWADVIIVGRGGGSAEDLWAFNEEPVVRAVFASTLPVISAVGHETDFSLCDRAADLRAPTPSAAAELAVSDISPMRQWLEQVDDAFYAACIACLDAKNEALATRIRLLRNLEPSHILNEQLQTLNIKDTQLQRTIQNRIYLVDTTLEMKAATLQALHPKSILSRGYAILTDEDGHLLHNADVGQRIMVETDTTRIKADVISSKEKTAE